MFQAGNSRHPHPHTDVAVADTVDSHRPGRTPLLRHCLDSTLAAVAAADHLHSMLLLPHRLDNIVEVVAPAVHSTLRHHSTLHPVAVAVAVVVVVAAVVVAVVVVALAVADIVDISHYLHRPRFLVCFPSSKAK